ncbi:hypothetical protein HDE_12928 [Halotydeus destructor]|nr:hypothetical protein HDE_12928 [Halotydeus destructor]
MWSGIAFRDGWTETPCACEYLDGRLCVCDTDGNFCGKLELFKSKPKTFREEVVFTSGFFQAGETSTKQKVFSRVSFPVDSDYGNVHDVLLVKPGSGGSTKLTLRSNWPYTMLNCEHIKPRCDTMYVFTTNTDTPRFDRIKLSLGHKQYWHGILKHFLWIAHRRDRFKFIEKPNYSLTVSTMNGIVNKGERNYLKIRMNVGTNVFVHHYFVYFLLPFIRDSNHHITLNKLFFDPVFQLCDLHNTATVNTGSLSSEISTTLLPQEFQERSPIFLFDQPEDMTVRLSNMIEQAVASLAVY